MPEGPTRRGLLLCAAGIASGSLPSLAAGTSAQVRIANASGGLNLTMAALMREMKYLEAFDLAPELMAVADGSKILGGIVGGSVDVSMASGFGQIFPAIEHGAKLKVLGGGALIPTIAMYTGKPYVNSLKDLEGRTIGTGSIGALVHQLVVVLLTKYNVDVSKVRFVNIGSSADVFRAVSAGTVDAGPSEAALIADSGRYKVRPIPHGNMSEELKEYTYQGAWTSDAQIAGNRSVLVRTLAAYAKLYRFTQTPEAKEPFIQVRVSVFPTAPRSDHEAQWNYVQSYKPFAEDLVLAPERLRYMQELNIRFGVQKTVLPFNRVADMSLAADALKLLR
jgi:ABC-type nitrate/sulfonate/bicarbonate transport system substrate-binding protein